MARRAVNHSRILEDANVAAMCGGRRDPAKATAIARAGVDAAIAAREPWAMALVDRAINLLLRIQLRELATRQKFCARFGRHSHSLPERIAVRETTTADFVELDWLDVPIALVAERASERRAAGDREHRAAALYDYAVALAAEHDVETAREAFVAAGKDPDHVRVPRRFIREARAA